jgi:hypothetical protein
MRGAPQKGLAWLMRRIRSRMLAATSGLPGRRRDFLVQCQAKARRCQRRTVSGRTISRHRRQPDQHRYNTTHKSRSQRWRRKRRGAFFWQTASWWRSARISACRAARVRKLEATKVKRATKRELIVVATMISRMGRNPCVFRSDGVFGMQRRWGSKLHPYFLSLSECGWLPAAPSANC